MVVHCLIFANPEPTIKWFKDKIPLNLCSIPRYKIWNHPDDLHEHTIASIVVERPSYLDNGDFIIEVSNEMGFERRVVNVQFQTEDEYNQIYFQRYLEHKENLKYHEYAPGEQRWEDIVPEVKEFVFWEPPEEESAGGGGGGSGKKKKRRKPRVKKMVMTPWGDEEEQLVTDNEAESIEVTDDEEAEEAEEEEEEEDLGWNVPGEVVESEGEDEAPAAPAEEAAAPEKPPSPVKEPTPPPKEPTPPPKEPTPPPKEPTPPPKEPTPPPKEPTPVEEEAPEESQDQFDEGAYSIDQETEYQPSMISSAESWIPTYKRDEIEHPVILRRPKFYITDFKLRKSFFFVNKLMDMEMLKGKTLRIQSVSASIGPVTCEWRHNGRLIKAPTARKSIEFYTRKNMTVLEIENTRVQDSGTYTVTHYNDYTEPLIDSCKIQIIVPQPKETADQPPTFTRLLTGINHYRLIKF